MDKQTYLNSILYISDRVSDEALFGQLAEEAVELAKAALKLQRAAMGEAAPDYDEDAACANLIEEFADVCCCMDVVSGYEVFTLHSIMRDSILMKLNRWVQRITDREKADEN